MGSPLTHKWKWEFYTPVLEICELFPYTDEGWTKAREVEDRCIKPDLNNPLCLNEHYGGLRSLEANRRGAKKAHEEKDGLGRSIHGVKSAERLNKEKDEFGRSVAAVKAGKTAHKEKDEFGRSVHGVKIAERLHKEKDEFGRSVNGVKGAERMNKVLHKEKDDLGRSIHALKGGAASAAKLSMKVLVTFPDGSQRRFDSISETGRFLGLDRKSIRKRIKKVPPRTKSKWAGYRFELV